MPAIRESNQHDKSATVRTCEAKGCPIMPLATHSVAVQFKGFSKSGNLEITGMDSIKWRISKGAKAERMGFRMRGGHRVRQVTPRSPVG